MTVHLRLVAWNCQGMGRRNVSTIIDEFRPDILVISEYAKADDPCDPPEGYSRVRLQWKRYRPLVVLAADGWTLRQPALPPISGGIILPVEISGPAEIWGPAPLRLVAVAAALRKPTPAVNPVVEAATAWAKWLEGGPVVVAGDFGTSGRTTHYRPPSRRHAAVVEAMGSLGLSSAYHDHFNAAQGEEQHATYWHFRHEDKPFHIDHVFTDMTIKKVDVGTWADFHKRSDHAPMVVDLLAASA